MPRPRARASEAARALAAAVQADEQAAAQALVYVDDRQPGWRRVRRGSGFAYLDADGRRITDPDALRRIRGLAIPPAYTGVWICPDPNGHLQATGRDARGRKQYRYHPLWQALRGATKFERMREFGHALPRIRRAVERDLALPGLPREKVLATLVRLLDTTYLRVGNDEYARDNGSFGLTTLRTRHVAVQGGTLRLSFRGKSGVAQRVAIDDPKVARIVRRLQELPGQEVFQSLQDDGSVRSIGSADVNDYIATAAGSPQRFTAKDFRTWHASALVLERLHPCDAGSATQARQRIQQVIGEVAALLGHTATVCRKAYVHPDVLGHFEAGRLQAVCEAGARRATARLRGLKPAERQLLGLLSGRRKVARDASALNGAAGRPARSPARPAAPGTSLPSRSSSA